MNYDHKNASNKTTNLKLPTPENKYIMNHKHIKTLNNFPSKLKSV